METFFFSFCFPTVRFAGIFSFQGHTEKDKFSCVREWKCQMGSFGLSHWNAKSVWRRNSFHVAGRGPFNGIAIHFFSFNGSPFLSWVKVEANTAKYGQDSKLSRTIFHEPFRNESCVGFGVYGLKTEFMISYARWCRPTGQTTWFGEILLSMRVNGIQWEMKDVRNFTLARIGEKKSIKPFRVNILSIVFPFIKFSDAVEAPSQIKLTTVAAEMLFYLF